MVVCVLLQIRILSTPLQAQSLQPMTALPFNMGASKFEPSTFDTMATWLLLRMPKGDWLWPAIWMLPRLSTYGEWPSSGEIDICEARGNVNYNSTELGFGSVYSTLHWGPSWQYNGNTSINMFNIFALGFPTTRQSKSLSDAFHTFGLYWDSTQLYTYIDTPSNRILTVDLTSPFFARKSSEWQGLFNPWQSGTAAAPFDQQFYLVLSLSGNNKFIC